MKKMKGNLVITLGLLVGITTVWFGCAPLPEQQPVKSEYAALCNTIARGGGGTITKEQFVGAADDKVLAAKIFDTCDVDHKGYITEEDVNAKKMRQLQSVIRATEVH
jgi:Ca2+-binding EF-hand superfamily protein